MKQNFNEISIGEITLKGNSEISELVKLILGLLKEDNVKKYLGICSEKTIKETVYLGSRKNQIINRMPPINVDKILKTSRKNIYNWEGRQRIEENVK